MVVLGVTLVVVTGNPAGACTCGRLSTDRAAETFDAVFSGTVAAWPEGEYLGPGTWEFNVDEVYVGELGPTVNVYSGGPCGIHAGVGDEVIAFLGWDEVVGADDEVIAGPMWQVDGCTLQRPTDMDALDLDEIGAARAPDPAIGPGPVFTSEDDETSYWPVALGVGALAVACGIGLVLLRRRRSSESEPTVSEPV